MFKTVLLAVDVNDTEGATQSTKAAIAIATQNNAKLHILNVVPDQGMAIVSAAMSPGHADAIVEDARSGLAEWAAANIPDALDTELHIAKGTVYDQIIKSAHGLGVDCIVIGAHSPALKDYLIGPNAARVARHATQSVFVIR